MEDLRTELLSINGVGRETADSMILYAANKPIFVVDVYTRRTLERHGLITEKADYDEIRELFERSLEPDVALFNDYPRGIRSCGIKLLRAKTQVFGMPSGWVWGKRASDSRSD